MNAYKCMVKLTIHEVTSPGTRLANKNGIFVRVNLLEQQRTTKSMPGYFPLRFQDTLSFEKSFRYCRDEIDVVNNLNESRVLLELVQRQQRAAGSGRLAEQVLAYYETNAKEFLYPSPGEQIKSTNNRGQRDVFLIRNENYPGNISPQLIFCASVRIRETQTPSMDILKQHEERVQNRHGRPGVSLGGAARPRSAIKPKRGQAARATPRVMFASQHPSKPALKQQQRPISRGGSGRSLRTPVSVGYVTVPSESSGEFASHTISSAIKADYAQPDVKFKLDELNESVKRTRVVKRIPRRRRSLVAHEKPFVVRKVEDSLILRKPELHDVLHDGLVLYRKSPHPSRSTSRLRSRSLTFLNNYMSENDLDRYNNPHNHLDHDHHHHRSHVRNTQPTRAIFDYSPSHYRSRSPSLIHCGGSDNESGGQQRRRPRSLSPNMISLNRDLARENYRPRSRSRSRSASRSSSVNNHNSSNEFLQHNHSRSRSPSNCEVCDRIQDRILARSRLHHIDTLKTDYPNAIFDSSSSTNDSLNETRVLDGNDAAISRAHQISNQLRSRINQNINNYPKKASLGRYRNSSSLLEYDESYHRYYPWLNNYMQYLRDLETELEVLKLKSGRHY